MKLRVQHVKCILSFREDETKVKIRMFDLFRPKDVYIRQLQVRMRISAINSPTPQWLVRGASSGLRGCRRRRSSKIGRRIQTLNTTFMLTSMLVFGSKFAVQIKCHSKTLDCFKERRWGWWWGEGGTRQFVDRIIRGQNNSSTDHETTRRYYMNKLVDTFILSQLTSK